MNIGMAIKLARKSIGVSQKYLSNITGYSTSHISLIESNRRDPSISTLETLAYALELPVGVLLFLSFDKNDLHGLEESCIKNLSKLALELIKQGK